MAQKFFYYDMTNCTGCKCCEVACQVENRLEPDYYFRKVSNYEGGQFPDVWAACTSLACNHCASPACFASCPVQAIIKDEDTGIVKFDAELCIGCEACIIACPYSAPVALGDGTVNKCQACYHLLELGEKPACVAICSTRSLFFGEKEELEAYIKGRETTSDLSVLADSSTTTPSLLITPKKEMI